MRDMYISNYLARVSIPPNHYAILHVCLFWCFNDESNHEFILIAFTATSEGYPHYNGHSLRTMAVRSDFIEPFKYITLV